jgi:hypothetical protein
MTYAMDVEEARIEGAAERIARGDLTNTERRLLRLLADWDRGEGVHFDDQPRGRTRHPATDATFNDATFRPLARCGLLDAGNGYRDPVRITAAGREVLNTRRGR